MLDSSNKPYLRFVTTKTWTCLHPNVGYFHAMTQRLGCRFTLVDSWQWLSLQHDRKQFLTGGEICSQCLFLPLESSKRLSAAKCLNRNSSTGPFSKCVVEVRGNIQSGCFLILSVTDSPAICRRWMASLSGFPFRLTPLMARTLSPMWMAPVLQGRESTDRNTSLYWTVHRGMLGNLRLCQRAVWDGHKDASLLYKKARRPLFSVLFIREKHFPNWAPLIRIPVQPHF